MEPLYFGCLGDTGHFVSDREGNRVWKSPHSEFLRHRDGNLAPKNTTEQGKAIVYHEKEFTVVAFWDYSVDTRPGSNSMFLLPAHLSGEEALKLAKGFFPHIFRRFKFQVEILHEIGFCDPIEEQEEKMAAHEIKIGRLKLSIWKNEDKEKGDWYSITIKRFYQDAEGKWHFAHTFGKDDALLVSEMFRQAWFWINQQKPNL